MVFVLIQDVLRDAKEGNIQDVTQIPYFEGDFWPNVLEENIKELEQEEQDKRRREEVEATAGLDSEEIKQEGEEVAEVGHFYHLCLSVCLSLCLCVSVYLSLSMSVCVSLPLCMSVCVSRSFCMSLSVYLSALCVSSSLSVYLCLVLSVSFCLSV